MNLRHIYSIEKFQSSLLGRIDLNQKKVMKKLEQNMSIYSYYFVDFSIEYNFT